MHHNDQNELRREVLRDRAMWHRDFAAKRLKQLQVLRELVGELNDLPPGVTTPLPEVPHNDFFVFDRGVLQACLQDCRNDNRMPEKRCSDVRCSVGLCEECLTVNNIIAVKKMVDLLHERTRDRPKMFSTIEEFNKFCRTKPQWQVLHHCVMENASDSDEAFVLEFVNLVVYLTRADYMDGDTYYPGLNFDYQLVCSLPVLFDLLAVKCGNGSTQSEISWTYIQQCKVSIKLPPVAACCLTFLAYTLKVRDTNGFLCTAAAHALSIYREGWDFVGFLNMFASETWTRTRERATVGATSSTDRK